MNRLPILTLAAVLAACEPNEAYVQDDFAYPDILSVNAEDQAVVFDSVDQELTGAFGINGTVAQSRVKLTAILEGQLYWPTTLAFKPGDGSLWVLNKGDDSTVIIDAPGTASQQVAHFYDDSAHFMNNPTQMAFSRLKSEFAVSLDSVNDYNGAAPPNYFTGPTLFTSNRQYFEGGTQSHLDMLHHSPRAMGIAAGARPSSSAADMREYWVFNGESGSIDRYFFNQPHELGGDDHSDGVTVRYANGALQRTSEAPGHLAFDKNTRQLYVADTGHGRIVKLDTRTPMNAARRISGHQDETPLWSLSSTAVVPVVTGLAKPSGLILKGTQLVVGEYATGRIKTYSTTGTLKGTVDTGLGANTLTGIAESPEGKLFILDGRAGRLLRLEIL